MTVFSENLKKLRKQFHLSQQELADRLNIGRSTLANYEQGKREPNFETLELFCDFFNVDMNILLSENSQNTITYDTDISMLNKIVFNPIDWNVTYNAETSEYLLSKQSDYYVLSSFDFLKLIELINCNTQDVIENFTHELNDLNLDEDNSFSL